MGTLAEKVVYLNETKKLIKDALNDLGANIEESDTFRSYVGKINDIIENYPEEES